MKTLEEIKKVLEHCIETGMACHMCDYVVRCLKVVRGKPIMQDALALIQQLETKDGEQAQRIADLEQELASVKRERDAAVAGLKKAAALGKVCIGCIHVDCEIGEMCQQNDFDCWNCRPGCVCKGCVNNSLWQWRGVCPEDTEVQEDE